MNRTGGHQGWQLEGERLAAACRENGEQRLARHRCLCRLLLQGFAVVGAERVVAEEQLEVVVQVERRVAILATFGAGGVPEERDDILHLRKVVEHPSRGGGCVVFGVDESQGIGQGARVLLGDGREVGVFADSAFELLSDERFQSLGTAQSFRIYHAKESPELFLVGQQGGVYRLKSWR